MSLSKHSSELFEGRLRRAVEAERVRPAVTIAYAQSLNGTITRRRGEPTKISCPESDEFTHTLRGLHDGIAIGVGTLLSDNPQLTCRNGSGSSPIPIVFDSSLRTPPDARIFAEHPRVVLLCKNGVPGERKRQYDDSVAQILPILYSEGARPLEPVLKEMRSRLSIRSLMVEGGASLIHSFLEARLFDLLAVTVSPRIIGGYQIGGHPDLDVSLEEKEWTVLGDDLLFVAGRVSGDE